MFHYSTKQKVTAQNHKRHEEIICCDWESGIVDCGIRALRSSNNSNHKKHKIWILKVIKELLKDNCYPQKKNYMVRKKNGEIWKRNSFRKENIATENEK